MVSEFLMFEIDLEMISLIPLSWKNSYILSFSLLNAHISKNIFCRSDSEVSGLIIISSYLLYSDTLSMNLEN